MGGMGGMGGMGVVYLELKADIEGRDPNIEFHISPSHRVP